MIMLRFLIGLIALSVAALVVLGMFVLIKLFGVFAALAIPLIIVCYLLGLVIIPK